MRFLIPLLFLALRIFDISLLESEKLQTCSQSLAHVSINSRLSYTKGKIDWRKTTTSSENKNENLCVLKDAWEPPRHRYKDEDEDEEEEAEGDEIEDEADRDAEDEGDTTDDSWDKEAEEGNEVNPADGLQDLQYFPNFYRLLRSLDSGRKQKNRSLAGGNLPTTSLVMFPLYLERAQRHVLVAVVASIHLLSITAGAETSAAGMLGYSLCYTVILVLHYLS